MDEERTLGRRARAKTHAYAYACGRRKGDERGSRSRGRKVWLGWVAAGLARPSPLAALGCAWGRAFSLFSAGGVLGDGWDGR